MIREYVRYMDNSHWEPKVPSQQEILRQAKQQIKHGKSTGNVMLDIKAMEEMKKESYTAE